jgi:RNA polymerase sporulation-specific sigma factor
MIVEGFLTFLNKIFFFTSYINNKGSFPKPLAPEDERKYMLAAKAGDLEARDILIQHNLRLVAHVVKKFSNAAEADDMISVGSIGLIKAINTFKYDKGTQLATYAARCIQNEILMHIRANKKHRQTLSLQESVGTDREGNEITLIDLVSIKEESVLQQVETGILTEKMLQIIKEILSDREYKIIALRYGLGGKECLTQRKIAKIMDISRSYISRIEKKCIKKISEELKKNDLYID